jgi:hypothetical protein
MSDSSNPERPESKPQPPSVRHVPDSPHIPSSELPPPKPTKEQLQAALEAREHSLSRRFSAIEGEARQMPAIVRKNVYRNPLVSVGGSLVGGLVTGLLLGGIGKRKPTAADAHRDLTDSYIDAIGEDVKVRIKKGDDVVEAVRRTLGGRTPLVIVEPASGAQPQGESFLHSAFDVLLKTAIGLGTQLLINRAMMAAGVHPDGSMVESELDETSAVIPAAAAFSES